MKISRPLLTIAIPTYNRAATLEQSLMRLLSYKQKNDIEIIVSDNASTDNTCEVIRKIQNLDSSIQYYCNPENLGFDGNFLNCFERANGKYVWLLSDDDVILPGAIESILEALENEPICMHLNTSSLINETSLSFANPRFKNQGMVVFKDKNEFLKSIGIYCTFVSSLIFNVNNVRNVANKQQYFGTNILQSHIFLETMKNTGNYVINTFNCVAARKNDKVSYDILRTWIKNYSELLITTAVQCGFDAALMDEMLENDLNNMIYGFVIYFRQTCKNEKDWDRECVWQYINRYPKLIKKYKLALVCPVYLLKILSFKEKIRRKLRRKK